MKLSLWTRLSSFSKRIAPRSHWKRFALFGLSLAATVTIGACVGMIPTQMATIAPPTLMEVIEKPLTLKSSLNVAIAPICTQGTQIGYQASTSIPQDFKPVTFNAESKQFAEAWKADFAEAPFPQINVRARLAKVPIMMYHDIVAQKEVFFDVTPEEFEAHLKLIQKNNLTPISFDQLVEHLKTGIPLPAKPIVLTFDDGYLGHYKFVYPLLKKYGYPAAFAIYPAKIDKPRGRPGMTWEQIKEMSADPLVTIASHSVNHPRDLREIKEDAKLAFEMTESKRALEEKLSIPIKYFVYPEGKNDERVQQAAIAAGYQAAWTMSDEANLFAAESENLFNVSRIGQSQVEKVIEAANGGPPVALIKDGLNFSAPVELIKTTVNKVPLIMAAGGKPTTIHADSRYQVGEIMKGTPAIAGVDGGFFSLEALNSNKMIGPVMSSQAGTFVPAPQGTLTKLEGRPLVLISDRTIKYVPFDPLKHNTREGIASELDGVQDAFVAGAWLVKDGQPQSAETFRGLFGFDAERDRAFWGIDQADRPLVGVSGDYVNSVALGEALAKAGLKEAVMLDSGASASLVYKGESMMSYTPRPVPHIVALMPPVQTDSSSCKTAANP
ncbi:polysaccharide deacetylase family protein [Leptolyngbya sp. FACHB-17]|uniref:polysaccharide deacetylase family protein n=1 Tax=unclassified Leptolyngbya TaxID=2650499 RepID=UPI001681B4D9|nr:polysaccharide deacetylase family protein [Leptolyngbya sp. FACHB-17]MBD2080794.1 polysaccharide deacetylase family protein [Leptolyngbya sp. FACHB-17]